MQKPKVLVVLGPTASGKSDLAVHLALKHNGEVISADSRQVYKGLNLGTGKITKKEMRGVPHHLLDIASPKKVITVADYKIKAQEVIADISARGKLPIICGGTGFYIQAVVDDMVFPDVPPNPTLRKKLEQQTCTDLFLQLKKYDPAFAAQIDSNSKVKLVRALEIVQSLGKVPPIQKNEIYDTLQIGITTPSEILKEKIAKRLHDRLKKGMIREVEQLHAKGLSWKRMFALGLEYRHISFYLQNKLTRNEMEEKLKLDIWHYARRQKTWFKRDHRIKWFELREIAKIEKEVSRFLKNF